MPIELVVLSAIVFGPLSSWLAVRRGRSPIPWFALGVLIGPIAPALILAAPPARCPTCDEPTAGFNGMCASCGTRFRGRIPAASGGGPSVDQAHALEAGRSGEPANGGQAGHGPGDAALPKMAVSGAAGPKASASRAVASATPVADMASRPTGRSTRREPAESNAAEATPADQSGTLASTAGPTGAASPDAPLPQRPPEEREVLAYGVYVSGTAMIPIGSRYVIAVQGPDLIVQGPLDVDPLAVAARRARSGLDASLVDGRLLISEGSESRIRFALAFTAVGFAPGRDASQIALPDVGAPADGSTNSDVVTSTTDGVTAATGGARADR